VTLHVAPEQTALGLEEIALALPGLKIAKKSDAIRGIPIARFMETF
jgi:hypothetical protein